MAYILNSCGLSYVWIYQDFRNINWLKTFINDTLKKQYVQEWSSTVESSSKCLNYRIFKTNFILEGYLLTTGAKPALGPNCMIPYKKKGF